MRLEAEYASLGIVHGPSVPAASERLARFVGLEGRPPVELLQLSNLAGLALGRRGRPRRPRSWRSGPWATGDCTPPRALTRFRSTRPRGSWLTRTAMTSRCGSSKSSTLADARARGAVFGLAASAALQGLVALRGGDIRAAEAEIVNGLAVPVPIPLFIHPPMHGYLTLALTARGALEEAKNTIAASRCGPDLPELVHFNPVFFAKGTPRLAQGRHDEALADFLELGAPLARRTLREHESE